MCVNDGFHNKTIQNATKLQCPYLYDYRFHICDSKTIFIQVANALHTQNNLFDIHWNLLPITYFNPQSKYPIAKPCNLENMLAIASQIAQTIDYIRVDLFCVDGKIFVGELTFTPNGGTAKFEPNKWDKEFGALWKCQSPQNDKA